VGYFESEMEANADDLELETDMAVLEFETDAAALKSETDTIVLDLETETNVAQEISKRSRYLANKEWSTLKLLLMGKHQ
jgi:hypothetical protein